MSMCSPSWKWLQLVLQDQRLHRLVSLIICNLGDNFVRFALAIRFVSSSDGKRTWLSNGLSKISKRTCKKNEDGSE